LIGGAFGTFAGQPRSRFARVERDGTLDDTYLIEIPNSNGITPSMAVMEDRGMLLAGRIPGPTTTGFAGVARVRLDGSFDPGFESHANNVPDAATVDGSSYVVGGAFTSIAGQTCSALARLDFSGNLIPGSGLCNVTGRVTVVLPLRDGRLLAAGSFSQVGGTQRGHIARFNAQGQLDPGFNPFFDQPILSVAELPDGRLLVGGNFQSVNGTTRPHIARLHANGQLDTSFNTSVDEPVRSIAVQPDGVIVIAGIFRFVGGSSRPGLARLNPNGSTLSDFVPQFFSGNLSGTLLQTNGDVIAYGQIFLPDNRMDWIAKIRPDGSVDPDFFVPTDIIHAAAQQDDGRLLLAGRFGAPIGVEQYKRIEMVDESRETLNVEGNTVVWRRSGTLPELMTEPVLEFSSGSEAGLSPIGTMTWSNGAWRLAGFDAPVGSPFLLRASGRVPSGSHNQTSGIVRSVARITLADRIFQDGFDF
jgi:uncharacterized delta-60 repeat protein